MRTVARIALGSLLLLAAGASPARGALSVTFAPAAAQLSPGGRAEVLVVVENAGTARARDVRLRALRVGIDGVDVALRPDRARDVPAGATRTWRAVLSTDDPALGERSLTVVARPEGGGVAAATLAVEPTPPADATSVVEARAAHSGLSARPGTREVSAPILIDNHGPVPLRVTRIEARAPDHVEIDAHGERPTVPPGRTVILDVGVRVLDGAHPGKTTGVLRLELAGGDSRRALEAVVAQPIEVEAPVQDALLLALGIPGLILVPGIIILATASLLWSLRLLRGAWDTAAFPVTFPAPEFWVAAVPLSVALGVGARLVGVDLLNTHSLSTVLWVWLVSALVGVVLYAVAVLVRNARHDRRTPAPDDNQIDVLRKLDRQHLTVRLRRFQQGAGENVQFLYLVQDDEGNPPACWFAPGIAFAWEQDDAALEQELAGLVDGSGDPKKIADALKQGVDRGVLRVGWVGGGSTGPRLRPFEGLQETGAAAIVQEE